MALVEGWARQGCHVKNEIQGAVDGDLLADVMTHVRESTLVHEMAHVGGQTRGLIV